MVETSGVDSDGKKLKELTKLRGTIKGRLTRFKDYVSVINACKQEEITDLKLKELKFRLERIENLLFEFNEVQSQIEILSSEEDDSEVDNFESVFYSTLSLAQHILDTRLKVNEEKEGSLHSARSTCSNTCSHHHQNSNIKLPTIKLPTYDGNYLKWLEFRDTFESLIHSNDSISDINKFHYLRSSLEGGAALIIKSLEFSSKNYTVAWDLVRERYDNKKVLINNHLKALFEIECISSESHRAIRFMIDYVSKNLRALDTLEQPTDKWDVLIIYLVSTKLDATTFTKWEEHKNTFKDLPTLSDFMQFLRNRADILETMAISRSDKRDSKSNFFKNNQKPEPKNKEYPHNKTLKSFVASASAKPTFSCAFCNQQHRIIDCPSFKQLSPENRCAEVSKLKLCSNCLRRGHATNECRILGTCKTCKSKHNTLLHVDSHIPETNTTLNHCSYSPVSLPARSSGQVVLGTAVIKVINPKNNCTYLARAFLDGGSQSCFITTNLKEKLGYVSNGTDTSCIFGLMKQKTPIYDSCEVTIQSCVNDFGTRLKCLVVPDITGTLPNSPINVTELNIPHNIQLADPNFFHPSEVDMLLGAELFYDLLCYNNIKLGPEKPMLVETKLGWVVAGRLYNTDLQPQRQVYCNFTKEISDQLAKFWSLEEVPTSKPTLSADNEFCERYFTATTKRLDDGRFSVFMPFKETPEVALGDSYSMAEKRFYSLEKKLNKDPHFKNEYCKFIREYEELGHLTEISRPQFGYFMPHHAVIRERSETTRLRVVFDSSAKSSSNKSLNSIQHVGPVVQDELFNILIRYRQHKYVLSGDIQKMYRQIMVDESQRHLQLILWREQDNMPLKTLQLNTVTYGTACAPYLSTRCLVQLAMECSDPVVSKVIKNDFYVDDLLTGAATEGELAHILKTVTEVLCWFSYTQI